MLLSEGLLEPPWEPGVKRNGISGMNAYAEFLRRRASTAMH